ncbi:flagellar hook-associated protein FlgK [[Empedobacter] haloabium]|uniref:Flagellar hook-associated protein 1 n=1 Tax=[Empedobacter] haloabium TaxID=592317 RepID=A0ABZ1UIJ5_9BURK
MSNLLSIGKTGLLAAQTGIATTGHNITNASVAGYSRQGIVQGTLPPVNQGVGYIGTGTEVAQIKRYYDNFLNTQLMNAQANQGSVDAYLGQISQIDNMLSDSTIGLSPALQDFFKGVQTANSTPSLQAARESMLSSSQTLTARFHEVSGRLRELQDGVNNSVTSTVNSINAYSTQIADLNKKIAAATLDPLNPPNDLLDQRDQLIRELNQQVKVTVLPTDNNMLNVSIGSGQPLVVGVTNMDLTTMASPTDPNRTIVGYQTTSGRTSPLPDETFAGGALGGFMKFRSETLDKVQNQIGQVAAGLATAFNEQHKLGQDLGGALGGDYFKPIKAYVGYDTRNSAASTTDVQATITDAAALKGVDYDVVFDGTDFQMTRSDGTGGAIAIPPGVDTEIDGVTYNFGGTATQGDRFQIRPTYTAAADIEVGITDFKKIALAAPIATSFPTSNKGSGTISAGTVDATYLEPGNALTDSTPLTIAFHQADPLDPASRSVDGFAAGASVRVTLASGAFNDYAPGDTIPYAEGATYSSNGLSFVLNGQPKDGDTFTVAKNTSGVGDGRNGVLLAGLQTKNILNGNSATFQGSYAGTVNYVGNKTREMKVGSDAAETTVNQAMASQQSVSGVNLDEEAADLLRYQQAYQAAGKVMQIAGQLFDTLLQIR